MLLTGFDANRLKKLYLGRKLDGHDLLQALTRVNRPYKDFNYGYVVDFVDIKENFDATNDRYLRLLPGRIRKFRPAFFRNPTIWRNLNARLSFSHYTV